MNYKQPSFARRFWYVLCDLERVGGWGLAFRFVLYQLELSWRR